MVELNHISKLLKRLKTMNEGLYYSVKNSSELSNSSEIEEEKHFIRERILDFGFVSHMELVSLQNCGSPERARRIIHKALSELEGANEITQTYITTDAQNVIIGYCLNTKR